MVYCISCLLLLNGILTLFFLGGFAIPESQLYEAGNVIFAEDEFSVFPESDMDVPLSEDDTDDKIMVVIDPGHGGESPGAVGQEGTIEKNITLNIALRLEIYLSGREDIEVKLTRNEDKHVELRERSRMSDLWEADLFISIHANSSRDRDINQTEIYYSTSRGRRYRRQVERTTNSQSMKLAAIIRDELQTELKIGKGIVKRRGFNVIRRNYANSRLGAVLVETMYISNANGEKMLNSADYQDIIAKGLFNSIIKIVSQDK